MTNPIANNTTPLGFGQHSQPVADPKLVAQAERIYRAAVYVLIGLAVASAIAVSIVIPLVPAMLFICAIAAGAAIAGGAGFVLGAYLRNRSIKEAYVGMVNGLKFKNEPVALGKSSKCSSVLCQDGIESFQWKKKMIEAAQHNIILSGSYCGGNSFDETLDLISQKLQANKDLKVLIINSDRFTNAKNFEKIEKVRSTYPDRFQVVSSPEIWISNPTLKRSTNHAKILAIDYGDYFMLGGSSLEDKYSYTRGLGESNSQPVHQVQGWLSKFIARGYRDQDFLFQNNEANGAGKRVYLEALKLAWRWESIVKDHAGMFPQGVDEMMSSNTLAAQMLKEQVDGSEPTRVPTNFEAFHADKSASQPEETHIFCAGPEHEHSVFEAELLKRFNDAKERIVINHLYFHPTQKLIDALVAAANRGVKVNIVTNGYDLCKSPCGHKLFGMRNRYDVAHLTQAVKPECRKNIEYNEFNVPNVTLHSKVVVADDYVISGSSNIGYKGLVSMSDHEIGFVTKNKVLADQVDSRSGVDSSPANANHIDNPAVITSTEAFMSLLHRTLSPLIG